MKSSHPVPGVALRASFVLLLFVMLTSSLQLWAQIQPRALYKGKRLAVEDLSDSGVYVVNDGEHVGPFPAAVDFEPCKTFGDGFVTIKDETVDYGRDGKRDADHGKSADRNLRFHYKAKLVADRDLKDCFAVLLFVANGSIGSHWVPIGRMSQGKAETVSVDLDDAVDEVETLHVFCKGEELRTNANPKAYDPLARLATLRSHWKGLPAVALCDTDRKVLLRLSSDGSSLFVARKLDDGYRLVVLDVVHPRKLCDTKVGDFSSTIETAVWDGNRAVAFPCDAHLKLLTVATGKCEDVLDGVYYVTAAFETDPDMVAISGYKNRWSGSWIEKYNLRTRKWSDFMDPQPGETWFDEAGNPRFRWYFDGGKCSFYYRPTRRSFWKAFDSNVKQEGLKLDYTGRDLLHKVANFECVSPNGHTAYLTTRLGSDCFLPVAFDMKSGTVQEVFRKSPGYDLTSEGLGNNSLLFDQKTSALLGVVYEGERPHVVWFDPQCRQIQEAIEHAMPGKACIPMQYSTDRRTFLYFVFSDRTPGVFYVFRPYAGTLFPVLELGKDVDTKQACEMKPFDFKARDGALIHGYLTEPDATNGKAPPLVVYIHGGPATRDFWGFDTTVQFLASRGYAVLQVNYRGSMGYGQKYELAGLESRLDTVVIDDIYDGAQAVIAEHKADPARVGVMGASFGGWATYLSLIKYPGLYRAGIAISAVSHWKSVEATDHWWSRDRMRGAYWTSILGRDGLEKDAPFIDPLQRAGEIKRPIYVMHGKWDELVDWRDAEKMVDAMKKAGADVRWKLFLRSSHADWAFDDHVAMLNEVGAFFRDELAAPAPKS